LTWLTRCIVSSVDFVVEQRPKKTITTESQSSLRLHREGSEKSEIEV